MWGTAKTTALSMLTFQETKGLQGEGIVGRSFTTSASKRILFIFITLVLFISIKKGKEAKEWNCISHFFLFSFDLKTIIMIMCFWIEFVYCLIGIQIKFNFKFRNEKNVSKEMTFSHPKTASEKKGGKTFSFLFFSFFLRTFPVFRASFRSSSFSVHPFSFSFFILTLNWEEQENTAIV